MTLSDLLQDEFRGDIRFRGAAYLRAERVAITRVTTERICAVVRDGVEYEAQLTREDDQLLMFCTCVSDGERPPKCKHLWATILAAEQGGFVSDSVKPGHIPPFAVESDATVAEDFDDWDESLEPVPVVPSALFGQERRRVLLPPVLRGWELQLKQLREKIEAGGGAAESEVRDCEVFYEVDLAQSRQDRQLVVQVSQRQRRNNGQWGKLKPLKLRSGGLEDVEHADDRMILAYLSGATPERANWYAQQSELQAAAHRFHMPHELCESILPLMCATGRLRILGDSELSGQALTWDDAPAWEFCLAVEYDEDEGFWMLLPRLRRGAEVLAVRSVQLIVPGGFVIADGRISRLEDFGAQEWVELALTNQPLEIPNGEECELIDRLLDMPSLPRLELPDELRLEEVRPEPTPQLTLQTPRGPRWHSERLRGEIHFDYSGMLVRGSSRRTAIVRRDKGQCIVRNAASEQQAWSQLPALGFRRLLDRQRTGPDVEILARDLGRSVRALIEAGWRVQADGKQVRQPENLKFRIRSNIDWFELSADVDFGGRRLLFPELLSALARGDTTVRLDDGSLGIIPEEWLKRYGLLAGLGVPDDDHIRIDDHQVPLLDALLLGQSEVDYDVRFLQLRQKFQAFGGVAALGESTNFHGELRTYQREGLGWLRFLQEFKFGGCLADDMGLGKTVQLLALLQERVRQVGRERRPSLVVVPKSLMFNWAQEISRFTPDLTHLEYSGMDRARLQEEFHRYDVIVTTYGTLRRDVIELKDIPFDYVVLDEAQTIKNAASQTAKASRLLQANHRLALSGTPIENHLGDLWSIFEFLNPGMLGRSSVFKLFAADSQDVESRGLLARGLSPFILRRTKKQVANDLPEKVEQTIYCEMGAEQERLYAEMRDHYRRSILGMVEQQGLARSKMHVLEALLRLRQAACHPALLDESKVDGSSAKLDVLGPYLEELLDEGHKTLVFSQFTSFLAIVKKQLDDRKIEYAYLDGQTRNRRKVVEQFQNDPKCGVFLISLKAGGLGLNLTAADYVFLLDPWWNPAVETQAIDRTHRVGQTRRVFAYRLICRNTVEEKIVELQQHKRNLADAILEENNRIMKDLSLDDLNLLFS